MHGISKSRAVMQLHLYSLHVEGVDSVGGDHGPVLLQGHHEVTDTAFIAVSVFWKLEREK